MNLQECLQDHMCILRPGALMPGSCYCGRMPVFEFTFTGLEHAELAISKGMRVQPCQNCLRIARMERSGG